MSKLTVTVKESGGNEEHLILIFKAERNLSQEELLGNLLLQANQWLKKLEELKYGMSLDFSEWESNPAFTHLIVMHLSHLCEFAWLGIAIDKKTMVLYRKGKPVSELPTKHPHTPPKYSIQ